MSSQALEQMLENSFVPNIAKNRMYQTIDTYIGGTTQLYSFDPPKPDFKPIDVSRPINKPYGQHENKLIDDKGITGVYSDFKKDYLKLNIFTENLGENHRNKDMGLDIDISYKDMFKK